ncbi:MAG: ATP-binding protein [Odoribacteraceae bacterium]|jgi:nitrogen fixation/metabolism regulation signal transduction histidine kinase|nr:ATP-binding protein [Odoribacteraceae bacterium]
MTNHLARLHAHILPLVLVAAVTGILLAHGHYRGGAACAILLFFLARRLVRFQSRTLQEMKRFINAIRHSEYNISFKYFEKKGLAAGLAADMEEALDRFSRRLREAEIQRHFHDALLNRIDSCILVIEKPGNITWINKAALDLLGKPSPRHLDDLKSLSPALPATLERLVPRETKIIRVERGDAPCQLAATATYLLLEGKELKLITLKNVQSLLEENESDAWKKLTRVLTHEIMNSLTPIISLSETFSGHDDENRDLLYPAMQTIHRRGKGLVNFVSNYKKLTLIPSPVISRFPAREWVEDTRRLLQAGGLDFSLTITPPDMHLDADRALLEQVLINLVKNAGEAAPPGKQTRVRVAIFKDEYQRPLITVSDDGEGILPGVLDKIFVPFFTTKPNGSGIGLSICRQIINLHGGQLTVRSDPGQGSTFTIRL